MLNFKEQAYIFPLLIHMANIRKMRAMNSKNIPKTLKILIDFYKKESKKEKSSQSRDEKKIGGEKNENSPKT